MTEERAASAPVTRDGRARRLRPVSGAAAVLAAATTATIEADVAKEEVGISNFGMRRKTMCIIVKWCSIV